MPIKFDDGEEIPQSFIDDVLNLLDDEASMQFEAIVGSHNEPRIKSLEDLRAADAILGSHLRLSPLLAEFKTFYARFYREYSSGYYWYTECGTELTYVAGGRVKDLAVLDDDSLLCLVSGTVWQNLALPKPNPNPNPNPNQICMGPLDDTVRTPSGCRCRPRTYCEECIHRLIYQNGSRCPVCREDFEFPDNTTPCGRMEEALNECTVENQRLQLHYKCPFDCGETFLKPSLQDHIDTCGHRKVICDKGCQQVLPLSQTHENCGLFWVDKAKKLERDIAELKERDADNRTQDHQRRQRIDELEQVIHSLESNITELTQRNRDLSMALEGGAASSSSAYSHNGRKRTRTRECNPPVRHADYVVE